jgi:hypothetical protein
VQQEISKMSEFRSENSEMSYVAEASDLIRKAAEPRPVGDSVKSAIRRAARRLNLTFTRAKTIWYGEARRIDAHEMDALRGLAERYANIAATLRHQDEDFHRTQADALEYFANRLGGVDRTGD